MKKAMLSQPMGGKTDEEIIETRERAMKALKEKGFEVSADAATVEEAADEIMKCLKKTRKAEREVQA